MKNCEESLGLSAFKKFSVITATGSKSLDCFENSTSVKCLGPCLPKMVFVVALLKEWVSQILWSFTLGEGNKRSS